VRALLLILLFVIALGAASCGSSSKKGAKAGTTTEQQATASTETAAPPELEGDWRMTLRKTDLPPNPDPVLADGVGTWLLAVSNHDVDKRRSLTLWGPDPRTGKATRDPHFLLDSPRLGVKGNLLLLHDVECGAPNGPAPVLPLSSYRWRVRGRSLTFARMTERCPDKVLLTLLTTKPWTRAA
jgi:hypothetical protein